MDGNIHTEYILHKPKLVRGSLENKCSLNMAKWKQIGTMRVAMARSEGLEIPWNYHNEILGGVMNLFIQCLFLLFLWLFRF